VNGWLIAGGLMAAFCAAGHAIAGARMFYQPIKSALTDQLLAGVLTGMWHLITVHFGRSVALSRDAWAAGRGRLARCRAIRRLCRDLPRHFAAPWRRLEALSMAPICRHFDIGRCRSAGRWLIVPSR
jgi:hypothetical protein